MTKPKVYMSSSVGKPGFSSSGTLNGSPMYTPQRVVMTKRERASLARWRLVRDAYPFKDQSVVDGWVETLRRLGLPELPP